MLTRPEICYKTLCIWGMIYTSFGLFRFSVESEACGVLAVKKSILTLRPEAKSNIFKWCDILSQLSVKAVQLLEHSVCACSKEQGPRTRQESLCSIRNKYRKHQVSLFRLVCSPVLAYRYITWNARRAFLLKSHTPAYLEKI